jgi:hypothetical protein
MPNYEERSICIHFSRNFFFLIYTLTLLETRFKRELASVRNYKLEINKKRERETFFFLLKSHHY